MSLDSGYVLLSRSLIDSVVFKNEKWLKVWVWCLMSANFKDNIIPVRTGKGDTVIELRRGQFIFGRNKHSKELNIPPSTLWKIILKLKKLGNLNIKSDNHFSVITVCNYDYYQTPENYHGTGKGTTKEQPRNNQGTQHNNVNNVNNDNTTSKNLFDDASREMKISKYFYAVLLKSRPKQNEPNWQNWCKDINLFLRKSEASNDDIKTVINFAHDPANASDKFSWIPNLRSPKKLREHFDQILLQAQLIRSNQEELDGSDKAKQSIEETRKYLD